MNLRRVLLSIFLPFVAMAANPPQSVDLDMSATTRTFKLAWAEGTTPLIRANLRNAGAAYSATGWTGTLYMQATWEDTSIQAVPSTAVGATYIDFQLTANQTATSGVFFANFVMTDGTYTVEWQRGQVDVRDSPGTDGAGTLTLTTALNWGDYTYSNTGTEGPYRAGANVTFSSNADGSQNIIASDTLAALTPTAGRLIYGNGSAWTTLSAGTVGQVLAMGASLPAWSAAGTGDITGVTAGTGLTGGGTSGDVTLTLANTAVTPGSYGPLTGTVDAQGRLTAASTTSSAAIQSALGAVYLPLTAGAGSPLSGNLYINKTSPSLYLAGEGFSTGTALINGNTPTASVYPATLFRVYATDDTSEVQNAEISFLATSATRGKLILKTSNNAGTPTDALTIDYDQSATFAGVITGNGSGLTLLDATDLVGNIPDGSFGEIRTEFPAGEFQIVTSAQVGYSQYTLTSGSPANAITVSGAKSANASEQAFVWRSSPIVVQRGFAAFKTTGAIDIDWIADDTAVADIRGIRLVRYVGTAPTTLYTDSTTRNCGSANSPQNISIDRSAFALTTVNAGDHLVVEITGAIEDSKVMGLLHVCIHSE